MLKWLSPLKFAFLLTAFDAFWAAQAMSVTRVHAVSNVELLSLILWCYFHLPAALLASALLKLCGALPADPKQFSGGGLLCLALLGLAQTLTLAYAFWRWWQSPRKAGP
jgi:hypothetical protein